MPPLSSSEPVSCPRCLHYTGEYLQGVSVATKRPHYRCDKCTHVWIAEDPPSHAMSMPPKTAPPK
jgi:transposase-like protein